MSLWTHVQGFIKIDTFQHSNTDTIHFAQKIVDHLPRITGSEGNADYYVILPNGYNQRSSTDEYDQYSNLGELQFYKRKCTSGLKYMYDFKTQSQAIIIIDGDLRDRVMMQTYKEVVHVLNRIASRASIRSCVVNISDWYEEKTIVNPNYLIHNWDDELAEKEKIKNEAEEV